MYHAAHDHQEQRPFSVATLRRIAAFARPHRRRLVAFLVVSVVGAVLAVATPVLAGPGRRRDRRRRARSARWSGWPC